MPIYEPVSCSCAIRAEYDAGTDTFTPTEFIRSCPRHASRTVVQAWDNIFGHYQRGEACRFNALVEEIKTTYPSTFTTDAEGQWTWVGGITFTTAYDDAGVLQVGVSGIQQNRLNNIQSNIDQKLGAGLVVLTRVP
jgi:hypothetical protein